MKNNEFNLIHGECIEEMKKMADDNVKVDMILTDLPYGVTANKWDNIIPFDIMWNCIKKIVNDRTPILFTCIQPFTSKLVMSNLNWYRCEWIYQKTNPVGFGVAKYQPMREHEEVLVFSKKASNYYPIKQPRKGKGADRIKYRHGTSTSTTNYNQSLCRKDYKRGKYTELRVPGTVQLFNNRSKGNIGLHPNQKPVEMLEYFIKTYSKEGDTVLDFTMGSGSTGVACKNTNRNFIGIELDEKYFNIAKERIEAIE